MYACTCGFVSPGTVCQHCNYDTVAIAIQGVDDTFEAWLHNECGSIRKELADIENDLQNVLGLRRD